MLGLVGRKAGMTRVFTEAGESIPVTVIEASPNAITQIKTVSTDGYSAVQVNFDQQNPKRVSKALRGHYAKAEVEPGRLLHEFRLASDPDISEPTQAAPAADTAAEDGDTESASTEATNNNASDDNSNDNQIYLGGHLTVTLFNEGQKVDVTGTSLGKGFAGTIKRHNFSMQDATHGNSLSHRAPGSIGQCQTPGRVFKGKKMAGQMGNVRRTIQNLEVVRVDREHNVVLIKGAVPGHAGSTVVISPAVKAKRSEA